MLSATAASLTLASTSPCRHQNACSWLQHLCSGQHDQQSALFLHSTAGDVDDHQISTMFYKHSICNTPASEFRQANWKSFNALRSEWFSHEKTIRLMFKFSPMPIASVATKTYSQRAIHRLMAHAAFRDGDDEYLSSSIWFIEIASLFTPSSRWQTPIYNRTLKTSFSPALDCRFEFIQLSAAKCNYTVTGPQGVDAC